jgi:hypothetical protein
MFAVQPVRANQLNSFPPLPLTGAESQVTLPWGSDLLLHEPVIENLMFKTLFRYTGYCMHHLFLNLKCNLCCSCRVYLCVPCDPWQWRRNVFPVRSMLKFTVIFRWLICVPWSTQAFTGIIAHTGPQSLSSMSSPIRHSLIMPRIGNLMRNKSGMEVLARAAGIAHYVPRCITVPVGGPKSCATSRLPHFLDNRLTDGGEVVSLSRRPPFTSRKIVVLIYIRGPYCGRKD